MVQLIKVASKTNRQCHQVGVMKRRRCIITLRFKFPMSNAELQIYAPSLHCTMGKNCIKMRCRILRHTHVRKLSILVCSHRSRCSFALSLLVRPLVCSHRCSHSLAHSTTLVHLLSRPLTRSEAQHWTLIDTL